MMTKHIYGSLHHAVVAALSTLLVCLLMILTTSPSQAQIAFHLSMDTSVLVGHPAAPFFLDFQLNDGSGANDANNTISLSNFTFGGGTAGPGGALLTGGATGDLSSG